MIGLDVDGSFRTFNVFPLVDIKIEYFILFLADLLFRVSTSSPVILDRVVPSDFNVLMSIGSREIIISL